MIDLTRSTSASPAVHTVERDPGNAWRKDAAVAIDAPPDSDLLPLPEARWPENAARTGLCGSVSPRVVRWAGGAYRMYYTQILPRPGFPAGANDYDNATTRILSAASSDGQTWVPEPGVRLSAAQSGAGQLRVVSAEVVPFADRSGRLRMYYESCPGPQSVQNSIRSAVSEDGGLVWTPEPGIRLESPGRNYMAPRIVFLDDGRVRLYVTERGTGIVSATSTDGGLTFNLEPGPRFPDEPTSFAPEIVRMEGGGYRMYYVVEATRAAARSGGRQQIMTAVSSDGLQWESESAPVVAPGGAKWDAAKCSEMCVLALPGRDGQAPSFRMVYEACDGTTPNKRGVWRIASAVTAATAT